MNITQLPLDEPLSPELVLVLPPDLRAQALALLGPPVWPAPRLRVVEAPAPLVEAPAPLVEAPAPLVEAPAPLDAPFGRSLGGLLAARVVHLGVIFVAVTLVTLAMSVVAHAVR